jgi:hypothetical protein
MGLNSGGHLWKSSTCHCTPVVTPVTTLGSSSFLPAILLVDIKLFIYQMKFSLALIYPITGLELAYWLSTNKVHL